MPSVTMSRQTTLRGRPLQDAIVAMVGELGRQSPYSMIGVSSRWEDGAHLQVSAGNHMSGVIEIRDGSPSTVTATINLLSTLAQGQRARVEADMARLADRHLAGASATASASQRPTQPVPRPSATRPATSRGQVESVVSTVTRTVEQVQRAFAPAQPTATSQRRADYEPPPWWRSPWVPLAGVGATAVLVFLWTRRV